MTAILVSFALLLDSWLGEVRRFHPLVGFGHCARMAEKLLIRQGGLLRLMGFIGWAILVIPLPLVLWWLLDQLPLWLNGLLQAVVLYFCVGGRSLVEHARRVSTPLLAGDLPAARQAVAMIVSRDTQNMDQPAVVRATVESVLENGSDAQLAPLFWFVLAGAPGALLYRLANTLDAMWGYRNSRYWDYGFAAAKLDDGLNWLPARLCAFSYGLMGNLQLALHCWRQQAPQMDSPNGGPVMAAGAGALDIQLGGNAVYGDQLKRRPQLGSDRVADVSDIERAIQLFINTCLLWWAVVVVGVVIW
ncbi:adenosylcobinamide-phosphate synthase CbiB [Porticoccus sp. W117]|uniref:adenosylcobinamide-phosphate synthase CbiB n=1 Tax=Porticoccus sp. W117 TaxID=3054777 RepID=UPI00259A3891|nr:adenosylcobinamide-phosphate synthase CbiB [Porticoccus sp. W117]MDM3871412.1 adenosylcobinamide-phosphate synthase CbiB [Porticoccus sp. W117]